MRANSKKTIQPLSPYTAIVSGDYLSFEPIDKPPPNIGIDLDGLNDKGLAVWWNLPDEGITDVHIYVAVNNKNPRYLGRAENAKGPFVWHNPVFSNNYTFLVYAILAGHDPKNGVFNYLGPFATGRVNYMYFPN